jgi:hypothetical protein
VQESDSEVFSFSADIAGEAGRPLGVFTSGDQFQFRPKCIEAHVGIPMRERLADLLRIATSVYVTDRIARRDRRRPEVGWSRLIRLRIEVADRAFWKSAYGMRPLVECLNFLTGDFWEFEFTRSPGRSQQQFLLTPPTPSVVCLYSGGLALQRHF